MTGLERWLALAGIAAAFLIAPAAAQGAFVNRSGSTVFYFAEPGEDNDLTISATSGPGGRHTFTDPGITMVSLSSECSEDVQPGVASCEARTGDTLLVVLDDMDDDGTITSSFEITLCGGPGDDTLTGGDATDFLLGEDDGDTILGGGGNDIVITDLRCSGDMAPPAPNDVEGGDGDDGLIGGLGADTMDGGDGDDNLFGARAESGVDGDAGDDLAGGAGEDVLVGHDGPDLLDGGDGADQLNGGDDDDEVLGSEGDDLLNVTVNESFNGGADQLVTTDQGDDLLDGGLGDDRLNAGPGDFVLNFGLAGSIDAFEVNAPNGADDLVGGPGRDAVSYVNLAVPVQGSLDSVPNDGSAGEGDNIRPDNEAMVGGSVADTLLGSVAADTIDGGKGGDRVEGGGGDDTLAGGLDSGGDNIVGGDGSDSLDGGPGDDSLDGQSGPDTVDGGSGADTGAGGDGVDRVAGGPGLDTLSGGPGNDRLLGAVEDLVGADGADSLNGDEGDDQLDGGPGNDSLAGGLGADLLTGGAGSDLGDYRDATGSVIARLDGAPGDGRVGENDHIQADVEALRGGRWPDTLVGNGGANAIDGGPGEDLVEGLGGIDRLEGGNGVDLLRSRGPVFDRVACGRSRDLAVADSRDRVADDCESVDTGGARRPRAGRSMVVRPAGGAVGLRLAGGSRFFPLDGALLVPLRSSLDATRGAVAVTTAGSRHSGRFSGGRFRVLQRRGRHPRTELRLEGGSFRTCSGGRRVVRRLRARGRGRFRAVGRRSATFIRRGRWTVADRCDGTLTRVLAGRARVQDRGRRRAVSLRAGRSYLARAR
ncbi:MAG TPA: calcium-binding protein [Thermoleophilaceae bacterium]|nr:calcium-binding protein [Thermoleophilaceae bacterium]